MGMQRLDVTVQAYGRKHVKENTRNREDSDHRASVRGDTRPQIRLNQITIMSRWTKRDAIGYARILLRQDQ